MTQVDELIQDGKKILNTVADVCAEAEPGIIVVKNVSTDIGKVSQSVTSLEKYAKDLYRAFTGLNELCTALTLIPIVGSVSTAFGKALSPLSKMFKTVFDLVDESRETLVVVETTSKNVSKVSGVFRKSANAAANNFHNYANSLDIIGACLNLFIELAAITKDSESKRRIQSISDTMQREIAALMQDMQTVSQLFDSVQTVETAISDVEKRFVSVTDVITSTISVFSKISGIFSPVANAFHSIINAIKPLQWVLKAVSCIFNKILKPIIDAILNALGIDTLIEKLKEFIEHALGITELKDEMKRALSDAADAVEGPLLGTITSINDSLDSIDRRFTNLLSLDGMEQEIGEFLRSAYESYVNQDLPDWPFDTNGGGSRPIDAEHILETLDLNVDVHDVPYNPTTPGNTCECADIVSLHHLKCVDRKIFDTPIDTGGDLDDVSWDAIDQAYVSINTIVDTVNNMHSQSLIIAENLALCQRYAADLEIYDSFLNDIENMLSLFTGLEGFGSLTSTITELVRKIKSEQTGMSRLKGNIEVCYETYQRFTDLYGEMRASLPAQYDIDVSGTAVSNVEQSWRAVSGTINLGYQSTSVEETKQRVASVQQMVEGHLTQNMTSVNTYITDLTEYQHDLADVGRQINDIIQNVANLGGKERSIIDSERFAVVSSIQTRLHAIVGLVGPSKQIIQFLIDKHDKAEDEGKEFLDALRAFIDKVAPVIDNILKAPAFDEFLQMMVLTDTLNDAVQSINTRITDLNATLSDERYTRLTTTYTELERILEPHMQYTYQDDTGESHTEQNLYVDDEFIAVAHQVIKETGEAA